jgi:hypothetical protein
MAQRKNPAAAVRASACGFSTIRMFWFMKPFYRRGRRDAEEAQRKALTAKARRTSDLIFLCVPFAPLRLCGCSCF